MNIWKKKTSSRLLLVVAICSLYAVSGCQKGNTARGKSAKEPKAVALEFRDVNQATLEVIMADAVSSNKIVFIDFYTTWCGPCKWMDSNVFNQNEVATKFNRHFINYKVDAEDFEGVNTALKYRVAGYPTYVFLTPQGEVIHRLEGMIPQESFMQVVDEILSEKRL